jgi:hypothetical protein
MMTEDELKVLAEQKDSTLEILLDLMNKQAYFEMVFNGNVSPLMREPMKDWLGKPEGGGK